MWTGPLLKGPGYFIWDELMNFFKRLLTVIIASVMVLMAGSTVFALTAADMVRLKQAGIQEDIIVVMVENNYQDVEKILKLKEAGFKDQTILSIVKGESHNNLGKERITVETTGRVKILWYLVYRGDHVLQNSQAIDDVKITLVDDAALKLEWKEQGGLGLLDEIKKKAFKNPFYWTLNQDDSLEKGNDGYAYVLQSTTAHQGKPDTDGSHYWMVYLHPKDANIEESLRKSLQSLKGPLSSK
jgi:hypothetical protein